jgi:hypothetical protein
MSLYEIEEHIGTLIEEASLPTDADLEARRDLIEKWKKDNEYKPQPSRAAEKKGSVEQKQPQKQKTARDTRPKMASHPGNQANRTDRQQPQTNIHKDFKKEDRSYKPADKQIRTAEKSLPAQPAKTSNVHIQPPVKPEAAPEKPVSKKKSFLERIKERFGRN